MNEETSHPTRNDASMEADQEELIISREKKETNRSSSYRLTLPSDGYEWKKYGQKFIKNIGKFRSYFKCQRIECGAKKTAEWIVPSNIRVVYKGQHTHDSISLAAHSQGIDSISRATNPYNLFTQVFGDADDQQLSNSSTTHHDAN